MDDAFTYVRANAFQRVVRRFAASGPGAWVFARVLHRLDRPVHRLTGGRATVASVLSGLPVVMLTTTGARTGRPRTVPVLGLPTPDGLAVIASNWGREEPAAWERNLRAHPAATIAIGYQARRVRAVEATGERRERVWREGLLVYPGWSQYERRAGDRRIAIFVLREAPAGG
jgi:deazaflavin-dependent oxidoreductase (nitroreductase family)